MFSLCRIGENLPDITKSRDTSMEAEQLPVLSHKLPFFS